MNGPTKVVALFPWGDVVEEFLDPISLALDDFVERMSGGWLFGYAAALQLAGHAPVIVCASECVDRITHRRHAATGTPIEVVPGKRARKGQYDAAYSLRRWRATPLAAFREVLADAGCNAILAQEYEYTRFDALALLARRMGVPLYATFQGGDRTLSWIETVARQASLRSCRGLIVASAAERDRLSHAYPRLRLDIADIPNPIDAQEWQALEREQARTVLDLPADNFIAVNHGRIDIFRKGFDVLVEAWSAFADDPRAQLVIIGSGQDDKRFSQLLCDSGLANVRWLSSYTTDRGFLRQWLSAADVYVTASRIEGMPVAPLEAMACGLPVVATDAQGLPDILAEGEASGGLLVRKERPHEIADGLKQLRTDPQLRHRLGLAARRRVEQEFSLAAVGAALDRLLTAEAR
ncbi:glycosyltransferase family 4 protein [Aquamicrobium soli]|uniref:Glycosyltransferase family 4 protein n=1 Tax=Aquamicrobium soli TaxID=1811518 RepID=A0ABV7K8T9_9HYPH